MLRIVRSRWCTLLWLVVIMSKATIYGRNFSSDSILFTEREYQLVKKSDGIAFKKVSPYFEGKKYKVVRKKSGIEINIPLTQDGTYQVEKIGENIIVRFKK